MRESESLICETAFKYTMKNYWTIRETQSRNIILQCRSENLSVKFSGLSCPILINDLIDKEIRNTVQIILIAIFVICWKMWTWKPKRPGFSLLINFSALRETLIFSNIFFVYKILLTSRINWDYALEVLNTVPGT